MENGWGVKFLKDGWWGESALSDSLHLFLLLPLQRTLRWQMCGSRSKGMFEPLFC